MKINQETGKAVEVYNDIDIFHDHYYRASSDVQCKKHAQLPTAGVCANCLKDRLINLVSSDYGVQRFSSSSYSEVATNHRNSCSRVSFLKENENKEQDPKRNDPEIRYMSNNIGNRSEETLLMKRSNSNCIEIKKKNGFWRIGRLFKKKRDKDCNNCGKSDETSDLWVVDYTGVSRSRSLCSFEGGALFGYEDGSDSMNYSGARSSISAARCSGFNGGLRFDAERKSGFSGEPRKSDFDGPNKRLFLLKESCFSGGDECDDSSFIDLKFDVEAESKGDISEMKGVINGGGSIENAVVGDGAFFNANSCQITMDERLLKKNRKSSKGWRWIFNAPPDK